MQILANTAEQPNPAMKKVKEKREWTRTTLNFHDGKAWIYKKIEQCKEYDREIQTGYYCALPSCKNELIFKWKEVNYRDDEPFKFHKALVKVLEKKEDDWRTGRKTHTYYAFCCNCAKKKHGDSGKVVKNRFTKKLMEFDIDNCDCATFIEDKKKEANQAIDSYESIIADCQWLITQLQELKRLFNIPAKDFKERKLDDFISQLEKRRDDAIDGQTEKENHLKIYNEWETKWNAQVFPINN